MSVVVAISGSHGSGKSTLCHEVVAELKKRGHRAGMVTESARSSHYLIAGCKSPEMHMEVLCQHVLNEVRAARMYSPVVCDRSVFDCLAYARLRFPLEFERRDNFFLNTIENFAHDYWQNYSLVLVTAGSFGNPEHDAIRATERVQVEEFDRELRRLLNKFSVPYVELPPESRVSAAMAIIEPLLHTG